MIKHGPECILQIHTEHLFHGPRKLWLGTYYGNNNSSTAKEC